VTWYGPRSLPGGAAPEAATKTWKRIRIVTAEDSTSYVPGFRASGLGEVDCFIPSLLEYMFFGGSGPGGAMAQRGVCLTLMLLCIATSGARECVRVRVHAESVQTFLALALCGWTFFAFCIQATHTAKLLNACCFLCMRTGGVW
jgi:hypothetical protein